jgi:hypothetical protein
VRALARVSDRGLTADDHRPYGGDGLTRPFGAGDVEAEEDQARRRISISIVGRPNVGKSSFLNQVLGRERVIVTNVAGMHAQADPSSSLARPSCRDIGLTNAHGGRRQGPRTMRWIKASCGGARSRASESEPRSRP